MSTLLRLDRDSRKIARFKLFLLVWLHLRNRRRRLEDNMKSTRPRRRAPDRTETDLETSSQAKDEYLEQIHELMTELQLEGPEEFETYFRVSRTQFEKLLKLVAPKIQRMTTNMKQPINACRRLAATLRFLASGQKYRTLQHELKIHPSTMTKIVPETCLAIWECLRRTVCPHPTTEKLQKVAEEFKLKWNFPNCIGVADAKHILNQTYTEIGSSNSVILMVVVDANYRFLYVSITDYGSCLGSEDATCNFVEEIGENNKYIPPDRPVVEGGPDVPHVFAGTEVLPLYRNMMTPFSDDNLQTAEIVYNFHLCDVLRVIENTFEIMTERFRIFQKPAHLLPNTLFSVVKACVCLHNYIQNDIALPKDDLKIHEHATAAIHNLERNECLTDDDAVSARNHFKNYFNSPAGQLPDPPANQPLPGVSGSNVAASESEICPADDFLFF